MSCCKREVKVAQLFTLRISFPYRLKLTAQLGHKADGGWGGGGVKVFVHQRVHVCVCENQFEC